MGFAVFQAEEREGRTVRASRRVAVNPRYVVYAMPDEGGGTVLCIGESRETMRVVEDFADVLAALGLAQR